MPRVSRVLRMVRAGDLVERLGRAGGGGVRPPGRQRASWPATVGPALAEVTALVGVEPDGTLRCVAANDAALHELLARSEHVLAAWNAVARARPRARVRRAERLVAWVARDFQRQVGPTGRPSTTPASRAGGPPRSARAAHAPDEACWARAEREMAEITDPSLRASLTRLRALALARVGRGGGEPRTPRPGGELDG